MSIFGFPLLLGDVGQENLLVGGGQVRLLLEGEPVAQSIIILPKYSMGYYGGYGYDKRVFNFWGARMRLIVT